MKFILYPYFYPILLCCKWFQFYILDTIMYVLFKKTSAEGKVDPIEKGM